MGTAKEQARMSIFGTEDPQKCVKEEPGVGCTRSAFGMRPEVPLGLLLALTRKVPRKAPKQDLRRNGVCVFEHGFFLQRGVLASSCDSHSFKALSNLLVSCTSAWSH